MDFFGFAIPAGRYWGIQVRVHLTFLLFAVYRIQQFHDPLFGALFVLSVFACILLHEFGHALAARWCDGEAHEILMWPLGGLAFVRPAFNPTAHLITTVAGPAVTLVIWLVLKPVGLLLLHHTLQINPMLYQLGAFLYIVSEYNKFLLFFNLIPAFPMDGGRILRDTIWHWMSPEKATAIAIFVSRLIAVIAVALVFTPRDFWMSRYVEQPSWWLSIPLYLAGDFWFLLFPLFIFIQSASEQQVVASEAMAGTYQFSIRERLKRGQRRRQFSTAYRKSEKEVGDSFHRCAVCGVTEVEKPSMDFRVCAECSGDQEYCREHLDSHTHK